MWVTNGLRSTLVFTLVKTDPDAEPAPQGHDLLHRREGAGVSENTGPMQV